MGRGSLFLLRERRLRGLKPVEGLALSSRLMGQIQKGLVRGVRRNRLRFGGGKGDAGSRERAITEPLAQKQEEQAGCHHPEKDAATTRHSRGGVMAVEIREGRDDFGAGSGSSGMDIRDAPSSRATARQALQGTTIASNAKRKSRCDGGKSTWQAKSSRTGRHPHDRPLMLSMF